jgi:uncharacterized protein (TIGR00106 family)
MQSEKRLKVIAEFSIHPIGEGTSVSRFVKVALDAIAASKGIRMETNPMSTVLEADDLDSILKAVSAAHEAVFRLGAKRVDFILRVDDRRDKPRTMEDKLKSIGG